MTEVTLLGSGTCRIDPRRAQTSACFISESTTFLFDAGFGAIERLAATSAFEGCKELHIHISHRHSDHLLGLFALLQCLTWADDIRFQQVDCVTIHATEEVCKLILDVQSLWGPVETSLQTNFIGFQDRELLFAAGPNHGDWKYEVGGIEIFSKHLPDTNNHGVAFKLNGKRYAFTGDATVVNDALIDFCSSVDVCVFDFGHITNIQNADGSHSINLSKAVELLSRSNPNVAYAAHGYLRHLQHQTLSEIERNEELHRLVNGTGTEAKAAGFTGELVLAQDGMHL